MSTQAAPPAWWQEETVLRRFVCDLIVAELKRLRPGGAVVLPALPWEPDMPLAAGLQADSLELLSLGTALAEALHLAQSGIEDELLARPTLGQWLATARASLERFDGAITFRTSGSAGSAKPCTHGLALLEQEIAHLAPLLAGRRRVLSAVGCNHIYGFLFGVLLPRSLGIAPDGHIDLRGGSPARLQGVLRAGDLVIGHPEFWGAAARVTAAFAPDVVGVSSTAPCPPQTARALAERGLGRLLQVYGSSETAGVGWRDDPAAPYVLLPYWRPATDDAQGLLRTVPAGHSVRYALQDRLAWQDERHFLPTGRIDQAVQVGGVNVFPGRVRAVLLQHPAVHDAAVRLMRPDEGQRLKAYIVPRDPQCAGAALAAELAQWVHARLSTPEIPRSFTVGAELPRDAAGKAADWSVAPQD